LEKARLICIANGFGGFSSHLAGNRKSQAPASTTFYYELDDFIDNLGEMLLPDLVMELKREPGFSPISTRVM
jgi:hypothetical protein